jgi:hypothetical protein
VRHLDEEVERRLAELIDDDQHRHNRIDIRVVHHRLDAIAIRLFDAVHHRGSPDIDRVPHAEPRWADVLQTLPVHFFEVRHLEAPLLLTEVRENHEHGARRTEEADPVAARQRHE